jgi:hypothetical protein
MKGDTVARDEGGDAAGEADAAAAKEAEAGRRGSNASSDTMLDKTRVWGTVLDTQ